MNESSRKNSSKSRLQTLASILKRRRESLDLSISEAEQATRIRARYIEALEASEYDILKDDVYSRGYVKNYADFLGLETKPILKLYEQERAGAREMKRQSQRGRNVALGVKPIKSTRMVVTPKTFALLSIMAVVALVVGYIIWQVIVLSAPPKLSISQDEARSVSTNFGYVSGRVEGGADLYINDSPVLVAADGAFRERIALTDGRNEIKLTATNRLGKSVTQTYVITATLQDTTPSPTLSISPSPSSSPTVEAGAVQAVVTVTDTPTWLVVEADGKEIFRGTMLPATSQTFSAADVLTLATGNAGVTRVALTNEVVQNKDLGLLGAPGEVRRGIELRRDTN
jgi:cytoskeletal protein RodZ